MKNKTTVGIYTLGCRVNQYESGAIAEELRAHGIIVDKSNDCDYYIVNTCAVTAESQRKSRQLVRRCASKGKVLIIGCASQLDLSLADIGNVIYTGGNRNKMAVIDAILNDAVQEKICVLDIVRAPFEEMSISERSDFFSECRAYIKIQDGCNGKCTYCIIPKCRGSVRSRDAEAVVSEARRLVECGYKELILTGIEVGAYNKIPLYELIKRVSEIEGLKRLRLGSLSPNVITERFLSIVSECKNFMPHIHLSIQSCCDSVLSAMKRPYRKKEIFERVEAIRRYIPNCMISADIIVGFPGESESDFIETVEALRALNVFHVHSFPYSEREGTPAASMPNSVPMKIRSERNARLISSCTTIKSDILDSMCGKTLSVLVEKIVDGNSIGHTEEFLECKIESVGCSVGDIINVYIVSHDGTLLIGKAL